MLELVRSSLAFTESIHRFQCITLMLVIVIQPSRLVFSFINTTTFGYPSFHPNDATGINYSGDATVSSDGVIDLTVNKAQQKLNLSFSAGRVTYANPIRLHDRRTGFVADFVTNFTFIIDTFNRLQKADGITFFLSRTDSTLFANNCGGCLGLMNQSLSNSSANKIVAVEFDTFPYNLWDPGYEDPNVPNHMGIDVNSLFSNATVPWQWNVSLGRFEGAAQVWYNSTTRTLFAVLANQNPQAGSTESEWNISLPIDLRLVLPEFVIVGFTAATGLWYQVNQLSSWYFTSMLDSPDIPTAGTFDPTPAPSPMHDLPAATPNKHKLFHVLVPSCIVSLLLIVFIIIWIRRRRVYNHIKMINKPDELDDGEEEDEDIICTRTDFETGPRRFSYAELSEATNGFSEDERLGKGGFGSVYRGVLKDGDTQEVVAVKRLSKGSSQGKKEYISEVTVIGQLRHRNLVRLIGWCHERRERLLVYEYVEGGSLDSYLFTSKIQKFPWRERVTVALDVGSALRYLHEEWVQCVIHRDIKTSNVLIDSEFHARLGDFGLARLVNHGYDTETTMMAGTMGYIAPECIITSKISKESDVYSFGVVLLELACGRRAIGEQGTRLVEWVWDLYGSGTLLDGVDKRLGLEFDQQEAECVMMVGLWCTLPDKETRPTISKAIQALRFQAKLPKLPDQMPALVFHTLRSINGIQTQYAEDNSTGSAQTTNSRNNTSTSATTSTATSMSAKHVKD